MSKSKILVIGANGQIGTVLSQALRDTYGMDEVVTADITSPKKNVVGYFEKLDVLNKEQLRTIVKKHGVSQIYHLAAMLSAKGEQNPHFTWKLNMEGLFNVLEVAREVHLKRIYFPSSIAVFGENTPPVKAPQLAALQPQTMYGITKVAGEQLCEYYYHKYDVDVRSLRYPGLISYQSLPGGGTTDYAVDIFHKAIKGAPFECFLEADTRLPMMYMPDAIRATLKLMNAPADQISTHYGYNIQSMSFSPAELAAEIKKHIPHFEISYRPDFRQKIARSWIESMEDTLAKTDWGWQPEYDLETMTKDMLSKLNRKYQSQEL